ncbi:UNVERIFIED_CONTAM: hypothetical protein Scaly_3140500 [Sesamum calycinum]|uniref:Uncharacterized protein n=1 Tax=Sesamum calycinum TaxID=2727403 RepID=A0AAW2JGU1_9LAMI
METNKFNGTIYNDWLRNLRIILDFENQSYVLDKPLSKALPEGSSPEEHIMFEKWLEDNRKVCTIIVASMINDIQKQYDRLEDVPWIMLRMREVYAVPDKHRYAATKAFFRTKMAEGSFVQSHRVKMLSLLEKLEDLKAGLDNDTYIDVILQSLPHPTTRCLLTTIRMDLRINYLPGFTSFYLTMISYQKTKATVSRDSRLDESKIDMLLDDTLYIFLILYVHLDKPISNILILTFFFDFKSSFDLIPIPPCQRVLAEISLDKSLDILKRAPAFYTYI